MTTSPSSSTEAVFAAIALPSLTLPSGEVVTATRLLPFREGRAFIRAMEQDTTASARMEAALGVLQGMGFPESVETLPMAEVVEAATRFFMAALQPTNGSSPKP